MLYKIPSITTLLFFTLILSTNIQGAEPELNPKDKAEAAKFIADIRFKSDNAKSEVEEAEQIIEKVEGVKEQTKKLHDKNVGEVLSGVEKTQNSENYKKQQNWIQENRKELLAKQAQPLPKIDYGITQKELEKDSIAKLLNSYRIKPDDSKKNPIMNYPLMIFVSSSIPRESLRDLTIQAQKSGGILVFRGLIGTLRNTQQFLGDIAKENVSAIIDPRLFEMFSVKVVPTFVVLSKLPKDCESENCNFTPLHDRITGNMTLHYALEEIANGDGNAKSTAATYLKKLSPEISGGQK